MAYLVLKNLTKSFQNNLVLDNINIEIEKGTFLSLLGPSGCGKTTTMRLIAGFETQDEGTIAIDGKNIDSLPPYKRNIGMVFQSYALFPHMTVEQNVAYGLEQRKLTRGEIKKEVVKALEMVQLTGYEKRKPKQLSGGQQQRVALARALVIKPSLLLLDESLSALDKNLRVNMQVELRLIQREIGITTVFVTHDQEEAMTLSDQIAVMKNGRIIQMNTPQSVYQKPVNTFVAGFLGQSNFFHGSILDCHGDVCQFQLNNGRRLVMPIDPSDSAIGVGKKCILSIRPERITPQKDQPEGFHIKGVVKFVTYAGNLSTYLIDTLGHEIKVQQQNSSEANQFSCGDDVYMSWGVQNQTILSE